MPSYYARTPAMQTGLGFVCPSCEVDMREIGFRCPNCNHVVIGKILGSCSLSLVCHRCKAKITLSIRDYSGNGEKRGMIIEPITKHDMNLRCRRCKTSLSIHIVESPLWLSKIFDGEQKEELGKAVNV